MAEPQPLAPRPGTLQRRSRGKLLLGASPFFVAALFGGVAIALGIYPLLVMLFHLSIFGALGVAWSLGSTSDLEDVPGEITGDDRGLAIDGRLVLPRDEIQQGFVAPHGPGALVRLTRRGLRPPTLVRTVDVASGRALLRSLGLDASQTAAELRIAPWLTHQSLGKQLALTLGPIFGVFLPMVLGSVALLGKGSGGAVAALVPLLIAYVLGLALLPTKVRIGVDGVWTRWAHKRRFISFAEITDIVESEESVGGKEFLCVLLRTKSGETVKLVSGQKGFMEGNQAPLVERLREALELHRSGAHAADSAMLARGERPLLDWVRELRRLGAGANADLRTAGTSLEALLSAVHDASLGAAERAGAAVAAMPYVTPAEKQRIRVAAETTAEPRLRVALTEIARPDAADEEVAAALEALTSEPSGAAERRRAP